MIFNRALIFVGIFICLAGFSSAIAQTKEVKDLESILTESRERISDLESATYSARYKSDDEKNEMPTIITGTVFLKKIFTQDKIGAKVKMNVEKISRKDTVGSIYYYDGEQEITISPEDKKVWIFNSPKVLTGNIVGRLVDTILISKNPFENILDKDNSFKIKESETVSGEPCFVFTVFSPDNEYLSDISTTWYISTNDYLPRKWIDKNTFNGKRNVRVSQIEELVVNPELPDSVFTLSIYPESYEIERPEDREKKTKPKLLDAGVKAPNWTLKNEEGKEITLLDYRGQIVILDFWGTWCLPCLEAMPELQRIHDKYDEVTVLGASTNEPANAEPQKFARNRDITYPILLNGEKIIDDYNVQAFPTFYIIGKDGKIIHRSSGYGNGTGKKIEEVLDSHL